MSVHSASLRSCKPHHDCCVVITGHLPAVLHRYCAVCGSDSARVVSAFACRLLTRLLCSVQDRIHDAAIDHQERSSHTKSWIRAATIQKVCHCLVLVAQFV